MIPDVEEGERVVMTWLPDKGTRATVRGNRPRHDRRTRSFATAALPGVGWEPEPGAGRPEGSAAWAVGLDVSRLPHRRVNRSKATLKE